MIRQNLLWNAENNSTTPLRETQSIDVYLRQPKVLYFVVVGHDNNLHAFAELDPISSVGPEFAPDKSRHKVIQTLRLREGAVFPRSFTLAITVGRSIFAGDFTALL
jgi:hypothetical protein